jgi:hypothetical protein
MNNTPAIEMQQLFARSEELCKANGASAEANAELREVMRRTKDLVIELMRDNEQLRVRNLLLERQKLEAEQRLDGTRLGKENEQLRAELDLLNSRLGELEKKSQKYRKRFDEIEQYNMALSNVYVASHQLHSTLDFTEVVKTAEEILWNLVAAPVFAIFLRNERTGDLTRVGGVGTEERYPDDILHDPSGMVADALESGESLFIEDVVTGDPLAAIPLKVEGRGVVGLIAVYEIEEHKGSITDLDRELFELLASQTATAISSSRVYTDTIKKLKSMESFISLIKPE